MKLVKFSITNYRSITKAHQIKISDLTILVGMNNEGKSNILKALNLAMVALQLHAHTDERGRIIRRPIFRRRDEERFYWKRDFPIALQSRKQGTQSIFQLEFELTENEIEEFKTEVGSALNGFLPLEVRYGKEERPTVRIAKRGRGAKTLSAKSGRISKFVADRLYFNYIPAVRTDQEAIGIIRDMLSNELRVLENDSQYLEALDTINKLQEPILANLAQKIKEPLSEFLPNIKNVYLEIAENRRLMSLRADVDVIIDDGFPTSIEYKGDGVKSLATLALLKDRYASNNISIVAIEEPESHLHPAAIHQLRDIVVELSQSNQVILSTHNPLFIDRNDIPSNIIINDRRAKPAKSVQEIREILGVQASDNLVNANYVLVVEGPSDVVSVKAILSAHSPRIAKALRTNSLVIEEIGGAGNLSYKLSLLDNALCSTYVLLDDDESGRQSYQQAASRGWLSPKNCTMTVCDGMKEAEFEDIIDPQIYLDEVKENFGVDLTLHNSKGSFKWSDRVKASFKIHGKPWDKKIEAEVKTLVAQCVDQKPRRAISQYKGHSINALINSLHELIH